MRGDKERSVAHFSDETHKPCVHTASSHCAALVCNYLTNTDFVFGATDWSCSPCKCTETCHTYFTLFRFHSNLYKLLSSDCLNEGLNCLRLNTSTFFEEREFQQNNFTVVCDYEGICVLTHNNYLLL